MRIITQFQANDGTIFSTSEKCQAHESLVAEIDAILSMLKPMRRFENPDIEFIAHNPGIFLKVRGDLLRIAKRLDNHPWFEQSINDQTVHPAWAGRIIDEISQPLSRAWYRIMCTDRFFREWEQPYFANLVK